MRDVDLLALAAALALVERGEDADGGEEPGGDVAEGRTRAAPGPPPGSPVMDIMPPIRLDDDVERRPVAVGSCLPEAGRAGHDQPRIAR